jgi:hypothetical protein
MLLSSCPSGAQVAGEQRLRTTDSCPSNVDGSRLPSELEVTYLKGMLKIVATRCTLGDVLETIRAHTGTEMEIAPEAAREVISAKIGPTSPLLALRELLEGEKSNYVMVGGPKPGQVRRLVMREPPPLQATRPGILSASRAAGAAPGAEPAMSSEPELKEMRALTAAMELPPDYTPSKGQDLESVSTLSSESTTFSSEELLPPAPRSERPANTPAPGQWPWQIDRSLSGAGYQSPADYVKQFQTGERR